VYHNTVMRHPLVLVIKDLWYFVTGEVRFWLPLPPKTARLNGYHQERLAAHSPLPLLSSATTDVVQHDSLVDDNTFLQATGAEYSEVDWSEILTEPTGSPTEYFKPNDPSVMYAVVETVFCLLTPHWDFDNVLAKFPYGTAVTVTGYQGDYAKVFWSHHEGWIKKDDLTPHKAEVWPHFTPGKVYLSDDKMVKKLRLLINNTFYTAELGLPLQAGEWVVYRLREQNRIIPWPVSHGRTPGDWQSLLKGVPGIHIGITPKTDSVMEWRGEDGIGRVAYVEKVAPDLTLTISVVGYEEPGYFEERILPELIWREFRPVFIEVL
jgi:hypothetical protein